MNKIIDLIAKSHKVGLLVILSLVVAAHGNIFQNQFVMDDFHFIVNWSLIQDWKNFPQFFIKYVPPLGQEGIYSPLKTVFHAINYHLFGLNPFGYHIVSLLIHFAGIYFVYKISFILTGNILVSFLSTLFFALHPAHVEAITYMTASVDMIGIVFLFAAFFWYLEIYDDKGCFKYRPYIYSIILSLLAVFTHELAISLPLLFLWYEFCYSKKRGAWRYIIVRIMPYFVIVGLYTLSKYLVLKSITRGTYLYDNFTLTMLVTIKAWAKYVYLCFFPKVLTFNHMISKGISSFDPNDFDAEAVLMQSPFEMQALLALLVLGSIGFVAVRKFRVRPLITFCIGWFFIALLPVSNIIPSGVFFGERYLYPGLLGFCLLLGLTTEKIRRTEGKYLNVRFLTIGFLLIVCVACAYSIRTWTRNKDWRNEITLYESAVRANPQSALMHTDLGIVYLKNKKPDKALDSFKSSLEIRPDDSVTYFTRAAAYTQMGHRQEAKKALHRAVELNDHYAEAYYNLAGIYAADGEISRSDEYLKKSMYFYRKQGRVREAQKLQHVFKRYFKLK